MSEKAAHPALFYDIPAEFRKILHLRPGDYVKILDFLQIIQYY